MEEMEWMLMLDEDEKSKKNLKAKALGEVFGEKEADEDGKVTVNGVACLCGERRGPETILKRVLKFRFVCTPMEAIGTDSLFNGRKFKAISVTSDPDEFIDLIEDMLIAEAAEEELEATIKVYPDGKDMTDPPYSELKVTLKGLFLETCDLARNKITCTLRQDEVAFSCVCTKEYGGVFCMPPANL